MKRTLALILVICLALVMCACGTSERKTEENKQEEKQLITLSWTENSLAEKVPMPKSTLGYIYNNNSSMFEVYLSNFTLDDFNAYVDACVEMGYTIEANRQNAFFYAQTEDHYEVRVEHEDGDIMHVSISEVEYEVEIKVIHADDSSSKYGIEIEIDGYYEDEFDSGEMVASFDTYLSFGSHKLKIINSEDDDINGSISFEVTTDCYFEFEINCTNIEIEVYPRGESKQQVDTEPDNQVDDATDVSIESDTPAPLDEVTPKESITLDEARTIFEDVFDNYSILIDDFDALLEYCNVHTFTSVDEIHEFELRWLMLSSTAYQLANTLAIKTPPKEVESEWNDFADKLTVIGDIFSENSSMDANHDNHYDGAEMKSVVQTVLDEFISVGEDIIDIATRFYNLAETTPVASSDDTISVDGKMCEMCDQPATGYLITFGQVGYYCPNHYRRMVEVIEDANIDVSGSLTKAESTPLPGNTTPPSGKKCVECGKPATKTVTLFGLTEDYCISHYNEIMDMIDEMESDVGKGSASKHTCEECNNEGTHSIIGISGNTEYYCTKHYNELKEFLEIFE